MLKFTKKLEEILLRLTKIEEMLASLELSLRESSADGSSISTSFKEVIDEWLNGKS